MSRREHTGIEQKGNKKITLRKQISVNLSPELRAQFRVACKIQQHSEGQLARILIEWSLPFYIKVRSVEGIYRFSTECARQQHKKLVVEGVVE